MYSPPPMDGFSPPPMSDFSPPPMEDLSPLNDFPPPLNGFSPPPDIEEDDADNHFDFGISDTSYDLTGLSDKMNSLEFDKMKNLPPREILELKKESSELNSLYSNNLKMDANEHMVLRENNNEGANDFKHVNGVDNVSVIDPCDGAFNSEEVKVDTGDVKPLNSSLSDCVNSIAMAIPDIESIEEDCATGDPELLENLEFVASEIEATEQKAEEVTSEVNVESESSNDSEKIKDQCFPSDDDENLFEKPTVWDDPAKSLPSSYLDLPDQTSPTFTEDIIEDKEPQDDKWGEFPDEPKQTASWSNFDEGPESGEWGDFDNSSSKIEIADERTKESEVRQIEFDEFSEDEFGDFGEADAKPEPIAEQVPEQSLSSQLEKLEGVGENLINTAFGGKSKALGAEDISSELDLEKDVLADSEVFQPIENPALTPGLDYKWRDSATYTIMLNTLGIDSRVVLDGESWRSSVPRYAPKNAATLLTPGLLTPQPVTSAVEKQEETNQESKDTTGNSGGVTPAEFDWNNSGLTNPLEENGLPEVKQAQKSTETPKVITELLAAQNNQIMAEKKSLTVLQKHTSREAKNILDGFPLLNFMTSSVLMFPTKSIDKKKGKPKPD